MESTVITVEDLYRKLNNIVGVLSVVATDSSNLYVKYQEPSDYNAIKEILNDTSWEIVNEEDLAGWFPRVYISHDENSP